MEPAPGFLLEADVAFTNAEGQNLNDEGRRELTGPGAAFLQEDAEFGRTFWIGVTATVQ